VMVDFTTVVHAVQRLECIRASAWRAPSLMVLVWPLFESSLASLLRGCSKILFPILRRPAAIGVNIVHLLRIAALVVMMRWYRSFVMFGSFSLLLELAKM
jgi:hypothetical protein